ncbi:MAG: lysozyme inhibitor LprI family protein [Steroidobacteraceae bacterium]
MRRQFTFASIASIALLMIACTCQAAEALSADVSWMLSYAGRSTNALIWDQRINDVVEDSLPPTLSGTVLDSLRGPPNPVFVVGSTVSASACVAHSCPDKGFFWIDTANGTAFGASASLWGCDGGADVGLRCELLLGSRPITSFQSIPASGKQALMDWMNENGIRVRAVRFIDAANETTELDPADFRLTERFHPPSTGPSFDCQMAHTKVETAICGNPTLAKLDLELADLYGQMRVSYATVGHRDQLRDLQRAWLARRRAACPAEPNQVMCLQAEYRRQHHVLETWVPTQEKLKK